MHFKMSFSKYRPFCLGLLFVLTLSEIQSYICLWSRFTFERLHFTLGGFTEPMLHNDVSEVSCKETQTGSKN